MPVPAYVDRIFSFFPVGSAVWTLTVPGLRPVPAIVVEITISITERDSTVLYRLQSEQTHPAFIFPDADGVFSTLQVAEAAAKWHAEALRADVEKAERGLRRSSGS